MMRLRQTIWAFLATFLVLLSGLQAAAHAHGCGMEHCGADAVPATQAHQAGHHGMHAPQADLQKADLQKADLQEDAIPPDSGCSPFLCLALFAPTEPAVAYVMPSTTKRTMITSRVAAIDQPDHPERPPNL